MVLSWNCHLEMEQDLSIRAPFRDMENSAHAHDEYGSFIMGGVSRKHFVQLNVADFLP